MTGERILAADDDTGILRIFKSVLESNGYVVETAATASETLRRVRSSSFDLALLDVKLPDMEGTELLSQLQKIAPDMVKIMMTGFPSVDNAIRSVNLHADAFLTKPFKPEVLLATVSQQLSKKKESSGVTELFSDLQDIRKRQLSTKAKKASGADAESRP